ncbi:MAG: methyltransferase domain-containing protein [Roseovarius sp.]|nr:methyltransferase domain-containing protein [Roseovarius sp.]MCY4292742.1 methyltransferase domain-containing protein [Roseovarius sp.]
MHLDVQDLRNFYYRSLLGRSAINVIDSRIREFWPEAKRQTIAGFGFAVPFLRRYLGESRRVIALMPAPQGVIRWPEGMPNVSVLCEETIWPLETGHVDKLLLVHGLETCEHPSSLLDECWRVLGPGGSVLIVVPNRAGLWSRSDRTPFGYGRPYSQTQLENQLKAHGFLPERHVTTLFQPPSEKPFWRKTAGMWERLGGRISIVAAGGILIVEAGKRVHAPRGPGVRERRRRPLSVFDPEPAPEAKPA